MKIYTIIRDSDSMVMAISEEKSVIKKYFKQKKFSNKHFSLIVVSDESFANTLLSQYDNLYLEDRVDSKFINTRAEIEIINALTESEHAKIDSIILDLKHFINNYNLKSDDAKKLNDARRALKKIKKQDFEKIVEVEDFVSRLSGGEYSIDLIRRKFHDAVDELLVFINFKDGKK